MGDIETNISERYRESFHSFLERLLPAQSALIITHDFPDPDALGAALGVKVLLQHYGIQSCDIAFTGFVGRAENCALMELLGIEYRNLLKVDFEKYERVIVVDTVPDNGNVSLANPQIVDAVLDHHAVLDQQYSGNAYFGTFPELGATSTLVTFFLLEAGITIPTNVATALFYGIKTDTNDMSRHCSDMDILCYKELFDFIDHKTLAQIEHPPRDIEYFSLLLQTAQKLTVYGDVGYVHLDVVSMPDYVPEMVEIFHSIRDLEWMIVSSFYGNQLIFSVRSKRDGRAGLRTRKLAKVLQGNGGGHPTAAAGRMRLKNDDDPCTVLTYFQSQLFEIFEVDTSLACRIVTG